MPILYDSLKFIHQFALKAYFRSVQIRDEENFPEQGPVILAVNHPSAFMDPIIIATFSKRRVAFLTAGEFFYNKAFSWFYRKLGMIPIYRPHVMRHMVNKNVSTFEACYRHLEKGGALIIFPEGSSKTEYHIRSNKTGLARIAFETAERHDFKLNVSIVPVGLVYDDPHVYGTHLLVQYGKPIDASDFYVHYQSDNRGTVRIVTAKVEHALKQLTWHLEEEELEPVFERVKQSIFRKPFTSSEQAQKAFHTLDTISKQLHQWHRLEPDKLGAFKDYLDSAAHMKQQLNAGQVLFALIGLPVYIYGVVNNWAARFMPVLVLRTFKPRYDFTGSIRLLSSILAFLIFSLLQTIIVYQYSQSVLISFMYFFSIALSGWFAKRYEEFLLIKPKYERAVSEEDLLQQLQLIRDNG